MPTKINNKMKDAMLPQSSNAIVNKYASGLMLFVDFKVYT